MIVVHHLKGSRSTRILWLLEELGVPYEVVTHDRLEGGQAAASLAAIHPLGKSPVIVDDGKAIAESGAILDYLARKYGDGKLSVPVESADFADYLYWLHFAEGSALPPLISQVYLRNAGGQAVETVKRLRAQDERNMQLVEDALEGRDFLAGLMRVHACEELGYTQAADGQLGYWFEQEKTMSGPVIMGIVKTNAPLGLCQRTFGRLRIPLPS